MTRFFVKPDGSYIGGFDGQGAAELAALLPPGAIEVPSAPKDARATWDGAKFIEPAPQPDRRAALLASLDAAINDAATPAKIKDAFTALKALNQ